MKICIHNNWHNGDVLTNRCLIKALLNYDIDIAVISYRNMYYLVGDLPVIHIVSTWNECNLPDDFNLASLCPPDRIPINTWCGTFDDINIQHFHNWANIAKTWNRYSEKHKFNIILSPKDTPMLDFEYPCRIRLKGRRGVYVETGIVRSEHCNFQFDMPKLSSIFPDFTFYCTDYNGPKIPNVVNCSSRNLVELSFISNQCEAIVGKGSGPFMCTLTEINRKKPKAVVAFNAPRFWEYRDNPLQYLNNEEELIAFLSEVYRNPFEEI